MGEIKRGCNFKSENTYVPCFLLLVCARMTALIQLSKRKSPKKSQCSGFGQDRLDGQMAIDDPTLIISRLLFFMWVKNAALWLYDSSSELAIAHRY